MFKHQLPEMEQAPLPPTLEGTVPITSKTLQGLRLSQLRHLARAYGVKIDLDAPKPSILPAMVAAEMAGVCRGQPIKRGELWLAQFHADNPQVGTNPYGEESPASFAPPPEKPQKWIARSPKLIRHRELKKECKAAGINSNGMNNVKMERALEEYYKSLETKPA